MQLRSSRVAEVSGAHQRAIREVAIDVMRTEIGGRISTLLQMQERLDVGSGTVQKALQHLVDADAVRLRVRGHQGTIVERAEPALLWQLAALPPLRVVLTPPGAIESTAVAIGLRTRLGSLGVGVEFDFVRGAASRITSLLGTERKVALLSRGAAHAHGIHDDPSYSVLDLGAHSYYSEGSLVTLKAPSLDAVRRIAYDSSSYDHQQLTRREFPLSDGYEYVESEFPDVPAAILEGRAHAGIWHTVVTSISPTQAGLRSEEVRLDGGGDLEALSHGVLVWRCEFTEIAALLGLVDLDHVRLEQSRLVRLGVTSPEVRQIVPWM